MIVPKYIQDKMHRAASHFQAGAAIMDEVNAYFAKHGLDPEKMRVGDGYSLEEIEYGNDVTDAVCSSLEYREEDFR